MAYCDRCSPAGGAKCSARAVAKDGGASREMLAEFQPFLPREPVKSAAHPRHRATGRALPFFTAAGRLMRRGNGTRTRRAGNFPPGTIVSRDAGEQRTALSP